MSATSVDQVMTELEALGSERTVNTYRRHGASGPMFGVLFGALKKVAKAHKRDHDLAVALWRTGNLDARLLATMIADPKRVDADTLDTWVEDLDWGTLIDAVTDLIDKSPLAVDRCDAWRDDDREYVGRAGWALVARLANRKKNAPDDAWFLARLDEIRDGLQAAPNRKRQAMHGALIAIGGRSDSLQTPAIELARTLGPVEIDHGDTACETPDAEAYILKMAERRASQTAKKKS